MLSRAATHSSLLQPSVVPCQFGEVDIDGSLVADALVGSEDVVVLNNGCLCCTVRGDLVRMLSDLVRNKRDKFDHIVIETTGEGVKRGCAVQGSGPQRDRMTGVRA